MNPEWDPRICALCGCRLASVPMDIGCFEWCCPVHSDTWVEPIDGEPLLPDILAGGDYAGGETSDDGDTLQYRHDGILWSVFLRRSFGDDVPDDDTIVDNATEYAPWPSTREGARIRRLRACREAEE